MAQYRVKALLEVEYDAEYTGKMASALEEAESTLIEALSKLEFLSSCEFKKNKNSVGRLLKRRKTKWIWNWSKKSWVALPGDTLNLSSPEVRKE